MNHLGTIELQTERLILRRFRKTDAKAIFDSYLNDEKFLYYANKEPMSLEQEIEALQGIEQKYENKEYYNWLITLKDGIVIGSINLKLKDEDALEFSYAIDSKHQNKGYMTEALNAVKDFAINELKPKKFYGGCEINNTASQRVMEKCGLRYEGIVNNQLKLKDGYHDMKMYSFTL